MSAADSAHAGWATEAFLRLPGLTVLSVDAHGLVRAVGGETARSLGLEGLLDQPLSAAPRHLRGPFTDVFTRTRVEGEAQRMVAASGLRIVGRSLPDGGAVLTATDVSTQLDNEALYAAERARYRAGPIVTYRCLAQAPWTIADISANVSAWGIQRETLIGKPFPVWVDPRDLSTTEAEAERQVLSGAQHFLLQYRIHTSDGGTRWIRDWNVVTRAPDGTPAWLDGYLVDITEVIESRALLQQALDSAQAGTFVWDFARQVMTWDARCRALYRLKEGTEPSYEAWMEAVHPDDLPALVADLPRVLAGLSDEAQYRVRAPDGWRVVHTWLAATRGGDDQPDRLIGTVRDVTEEVQARRGLERAVMALEQRNQDLQEFAYAASHDLQEPLRMVSTFVQLLSRRYQGRLDADADRYIGYAVDGAARMQGLIQELLGFARLGQDLPSKTPTALNLVVQLALNDLRASLDERDAKVTWDPLPMVPVDAPLMRRLFVNLIGNALKFRGERPPEVHISAREVDLGYEIDVVDNGIGFESEQAERIFAIFKRLHRADRYPGTGMGLAICRRIAERHSGTIRAEGRPGQGATFTVFLPMEVRT